MTKVRQVVSRRDVLATIAVSGAVAPPSAAALAAEAVQDAAVRRPADVPGLSDYGPLGSGDDTAVFASALADAARNNTSGLWIPPGIYRVSSTLVVGVDRFCLEGQGATISSAMGANAPLIKIGGNDVSVIGLKTLLTASRTAAHHYRVSGRNCHLHLCSLEYRTDQNTPSMYVRGGDGFKMTCCRKSGSNAFLFLEASDVLIADNEIYGTAGGDDAIAIKAIDGPVENIRVIGNHVHRHANIVAIGSNVGARGADDGAYSHSVRNVSVVGNTAAMCSALINIKPGALTDTDYRNGLVEGVEISSNLLADPNGAAFKTGIRIRAGHGAIVRQIHGSDNVIVARAGSGSSSGRNIGALYVQASGGGATGTIEDIDVGVSYYDPFGGAPSETAGVPGHPVESFVYIDPANLNLGNVNLRIQGNGCSASGINVLSGADGKVTVEKLKLAKCNASGKSATQGGFRTASRIVVMTDNVAIETLNGKPKVEVAGGSFVKNRNPLLA